MAAGPPRGLAPALPWRAQPRRDGADADGARGRESLTVAKMVLLLLALAYLKGSTNMVQSLIVACKSGSFTAVWNLTLSTDLIRLGPTVLSTRHQFIPIQSIATAHSFMHTEQERDEQTNKQLINVGAIRRQACKYK